MSRSRDGEAPGHVSPGHFLCEKRYSLFTYDMPFGILKVKGRHHTARLAGPGASPGAVRWRPARRDGGRAAGDPVDDGCSFCPRYAKRDRE